MKNRGLLFTALALTGIIVGWGAFDATSLAGFANDSVRVMFQSRGWFIMITVNILLIACAWLAFSHHGAIRLGRDDDRPEFSTGSWLTMMFAAGMGVGLLFYGVAEPATHSLFAAQELSPRKAAGAAVFITIFHWGFHAWAIYGLTGLVIAYFSYRKGAPALLSSPLVVVFGTGRIPRTVGWAINVLAIYAIAIGLGGSVAMGVFQVQSGVADLLGMQESGLGLSFGIFAALCVAFFIPLLKDLGDGMARLSNLAIAITIGLLCYIVLAGPTSFLMGSMLDATGDYLSKCIWQGFHTYAYFGGEMTDWFGSWTLNYMVWWLAWAPFVGVFIARISKGRTIREYILGVLLAPTGFSIAWFSIWGSMGFAAAKAGSFDLTQARDNVDLATFSLLKSLPLADVTSLAVIAASFLFLVTSVVSAAYVLAMFSSGGDENPSTRIKLIWGALLGALGLVMIITDSVDDVRAIIALSANPFVFIVLLLLVCLLKALQKEKAVQP